MSAPTPLHPALLRPSRLLQVMRSGRVARCTKLNITDPSVVEIAGLAGFDAVWLCMEHCINTLPDIQHCVRAAQATGPDVIVRVPRGSYSDLVRPFELGATAIMVPHVRSAAEAKEIAWQTKFHPLGRRALDGGNHDGGYCNVPLADYLSHSNEQRLVIAQIEDPEALPELDAIAATPGIDVLLFGPGDFTQGIGHPGKFDHPLVAEARAAVAAAARRHGKWAATVGGTAALPGLVDLGYHLVSMGADVVGLQQYFAGIIQATGDATGASAAAAGVYRD